MTEETKIAPGVRANTLLTESYLNLWDKVRAQGSTREDLEAFGDMAIDHKAELQQIEAKAKSIYGEEAWKRDLSAGRLTTDKIFSLWRQAASQLDNK